MAQRLEIVAILSSGISFWRFSRPYIIASSFLLIISVLMNHYVAPFANKNRLYPELYYIGNLLAKNGNVYRFSIMEKYDMTLKEYIESYDPVNDMTVDLTHLLNTAYKILELTQDVMRK